MNAVRMSHYAPDEAFLEACDELGLYVLDELSGWQHAHGTAIGRLLVRETVERDVNHPSILFWDNGNEGGWNRELDGEFALYDPQQRRVLHPWDPFGGIDTKHYTAFDDLARRLKGPNLVMPTEILHGLYDGGVGAGLDDYWRAISGSPVGAGAFIWVFADEGVVRSDQGGRIDVFSTFAPDGIVGPHFEKEGSFHTIRDVWSPVQIDTPVLDDRFDGKLTVHNRYDFTSLVQCRATWQLVRFNVAPAAPAPVPAGKAGPERRVDAPAPAREVLAEGALALPEIAPHGDGVVALNLPPTWREADALTVAVGAPDGAELWSWTWPAPALAARIAEAAAPRKGRGPTVEEIGSGIRLRAGDVSATFDPATGLLREVQRGDKVFALGRGPRLAFARPASTGNIEWLALAEAEPAAMTRRLASPQSANVIEADVEGSRGAAYMAFKLEISPDGQTWKTLFDSSRRAADGLRYEFPPQTVAAVRFTNVKLSNGQPANLSTVRVGYAATRFPGAEPKVAAVTRGIERGVQAGETQAWLEARGGASGLERLRWTLRGDGSLRLDFRYALEGEFAYHGVTFDLPEPDMLSLRWLGDGPYRVWQNRVRGTWLGLHENTRRELQPGEAWNYPEFDGYFAGVRWAQLATTAGPLTITGLRPQAFFRVGTPRITHPHTTLDFPAGDLSFVQAIPAMGSKGKPSEQAGPASQWAKATGAYEGSVVFRFGE
jgi:hypothetical protein